MGGDEESEAEMVFREDKYLRRLKTLHYYPAYGYLAGASSGAAVGLFKGGGGALKTAKNWGNRAGLFGLAFALFNDTAIWVTGGSHHYLTGVAAGVATGAFFKPLSPNSAVFAGAAAGLVFAAATRCFPPTRTSV